MRRLLISTLSTLILLCVSILTTEARGLYSTHWTPLMINLLMGGTPAAASLRPVAPPAQAPASERGAALSAQERISLEPGKPFERELSGGQSHSYKITVVSGQYLQIAVGLTRGFMYAGAPRVVASLWKVDDRDASELMKRFYQGMLGPEALSPAGALRQAKLSIWKEKRWREPYYWAAFVLEGEWK